MVSHRAGGIVAVLALVPAAALSQDIDAAEVMEGVRGAYEEIFAAPQFIEKRFYTVTRQLGSPDIMTVGTMDAYQQGENVRGTITVNSVVQLSEADEGEALEVPAPTELLQTESDIFIWSDGFEAEGDEVAIVVSEEGLTSMGLDMMGPMATMAFFDAMSAVPVSAREEVYMGRPAIVLRSAEPFEIGSGAFATARFWIDSETMLVEHMAADLVSVRDGRAAATILVEADLEYEIDAEIPDGVFDAPSDVDFEDATERVAMAAQ